ncbi:hypothetical protein BGZ83_004207 [Gryganskiella cystojenkinii]|nr:hypothetical protein BGZ83_004207 [Gryganskiella cystojenkinii]
MGMAESPDMQSLPDGAAHLPEHAAGFVLTANFENYRTGHYTVHWHVKATQEFDIPNGLHFVVNVSYDSEPDISGSLDVILPPHKLNIIEKDQWYDMTLEETLVIAPHVGWANVQAVLSNNLNENRDEYSGFAIDRVEIRPMRLSRQHQPDIKRFTVKRASIPSVVIDTTKCPFPEDPSLTPSADIPVTRIAASKDSGFMVTLSVGKDVAYLAVWDLRLIKSIANPFRHMSSFYKRRAIAIIHHPGVHELSIGLAISIDGTQIAVFQEPKIGEWQERSKVFSSSFKFRVFKNTLVKPLSTLLNIDDSDPGNAEDPNETVSLVELIWGIELLHSFVGYGNFLPPSKRNRWEKDNTNRPLDGYINRDIGDNTDEADILNGVNDDADKNTLFVACNGLYLDVYSIVPDKPWRHMHTITLSDLLPTLSRRITCKLMMDSIRSNSFLWLEDGGRSCSVWDLLSGSNVTYVSCNEAARFKGMTFRGHRKMAMSPHESIVAIASASGILTTYFASTGMAIDDRQFPLEKIEYVEFHAQDDRLMVILRDRITFTLRAVLLDTLQLRNETAIHQIPIPTVGMTLLTSLQLRGYFGRGIVIEADRSNINVYLAYQPSSAKVIKTSEVVMMADENDCIYESVYDSNVQYRLRTGYHKELLPEGEGFAYWVHRVDLLEEDLFQKTTRCIFSIIPEPWMRALVDEIGRPETLLSAFFLPGGDRFAINGTQTLQIWNLPTLETLKCSLQFIWSRPCDDIEMAPGGIAYKSSNVYDYYIETSSTSIFVDVETGNTVAEIRCGNRKKMSLSIPGPGAIGAQFAIVHCFRSIHLLAAAFHFANQKGKEAAQKKDQGPFTHEDHAEAIIQFTRAHLNRMMSSRVYSPRRRPKDKLTSHSEVVTIFTLLLDHPYLRPANHSFVQGLLKTSNRDWIPRDIISLNPIKRAIESRNGDLVEAFIKYCIFSSKKYHPAHLLPAMQCLSELLDRHPNILADMFHQASYVPAHNPEYIASHAVIANTQYTADLKRKLMFWTNSSDMNIKNINDYEKPVFSLRSQLPFRTSGIFNLLGIGIPFGEKRIDTFPVRKYNYLEKTDDYSYTIYVSPFPLLSRYGSRSQRSGFTEIAGKRYFDCPAMIATLDFKWHKFGFKYWLVRFMVVLVFFLLVVILSARQISVSTDTMPSLNTTFVGPDTYFRPRYLEDSRPIFKTMITFGALLFVHEIRQFIYAPKKYVTFTHALMHLLHTRPFCDKGECNGNPSPDGYPDSFFAALSATYFFLAGRYDPVGTSFEGTSDTFHIMMVIFFFFTAIVLLNILIALMNDAFNESKDQGQLAWLKQWSEVIAEVEVFLMTQSGRQNRDFFPDYIYYGARKEEAIEYESKYFIDGEFSLPKEHRFVIDTLSVDQKDIQFTQRAVLEYVQGLSKELEANKAAQAAQAAINQDQSDLRRDVAQLAKLMAAYMEKSSTTEEGATRVSATSPTSAHRTGRPIEDGSSDSEASDISEILHRLTGNRAPTFPITPSLPPASAPIPPLAATSELDLAPEDTQSSSQAVLDSDLPSTVMPPTVHVTPS